MLETNTTSSRSRKANGQGHTYPFGKGYRTVIEDKGRTVTATGKTEAQSKSRARAKLKTLPLTTGGLMPGAAQIQLGTFLTRWLTFEHKHRIAPTTYKRYVGLANMFIIPAIGQVTLGKLSKHHINQLMSQMAGAGQSPRSQQQARALLSVALNAAVEDDLIAFNPVSTSRRIKELKLSEVIHLAAMLRVNPTLLLRPTEEQLKDNSTIEFENLGVGGLQVSALDWYRWISGLGALPNIPLDLQALSGFGSFGVDANANLDRDFFAAERNLEGDLSGPLSTFLEQHEVPLSGMSDAMSFENAPIVNTAMTKAELELRQSRAITLLISDLRIALEQMEVLTDSKDVQKQIAWTYRRLGRRLLEYGLKDQSLLDGIRQATAEGD